MTAYFKYTKGEAFTLNGSNYVGFFNVEDGIAYSGRFRDESSEPLSPKKTFITSIYLSKLELDTTYQNVPVLYPAFSNPFDIINQQELSTLLNRVDRNNIDIFRSLVIQHPKVFPLAKNFQFYGLSASPSDLSQDSITPKRVYTHIEPFSNIPDWEFLDEINYGTMLPGPNDRFAYIAIGDSSQHMISGSFTEALELTHISSEETTNILPFFDQVDNNLQIIDEDRILVYDAENFKKCGTLLLTDIIPISATRTPIYKWGNTPTSYKQIPITWNFAFQAPNTDIRQHLIRMGRNIRVEVNHYSLFIVDKYSSKVFQSYSLDKLGIGEIHSLDVRTIDDNIVILHSKDDDIFLTSFDPKTVTTSLKTREILSFSIDNRTQIKFAEHDSNVVFTHNSKTFQSRWLSAPKYPSGSLDIDDLLYLRKHKWNDTHERWGKIRIKYNSNTEKSNSYSNLVVDSKIVGDFLHILLHNTGRLYVIKQPLENFYLNSVSIGLDKKYQGIGISETSIGLHLNYCLSNIVADAISLFNEASYVYQFTPDGVTLQELKELEYSEMDLYMNGNETINVSTLQRILTSILNIQHQLLATIQRRSAG